MQDLIQIFEGVEDSRRSNATRQDLCEMPVIGLLCAARGGEGRVDMARFGSSKLEFLRKFMKLKHGVPSRDAFSDLFNALDPGGLRGALSELSSSRGERLKDDAVAVDGKDLRRSFKDAAATALRHRRATRRSRATRSASISRTPTTRKRCCFSVTWTRTTAASSCARQRFATMSKLCRICTTSRGWRPSARPRRRARSRESGKPRRGSSFPARR